MVRLPIGSLFTFVDRAANRPHLIGKQTLRSTSGRSGLPSVSTTGMTLRALGRHPRVPLKPGRLHVHTHAFRSVGIRTLRLVDMETPASGSIAGWRSGGMEEVNVHTFTRPYPTEWVMMRAFPTTTLPAPARPSALPSPDRTVLPRCARLHDATSQTRASRCARRRCPRARSRP